MALPTPCREVGAERAASGWCEEGAGGEESVEPNRLTKLSRKPSKFSHPRLNRAGHMGTGTSDSFANVIARSQDATDT